MTSTSISFPALYHRSTRAEILARDVDRHNLVEELRKPQRRNWQILATCIQRCHAASISRAAWRSAPEASLRSGDRYRCKTLACPSCGAGMWRKAIRKTLERFRYVDVDDVSIAFIAGSCQTNMEAVRVEVRRMRRTLRDLRDAMGEKRASWRSVECAGLVDLMLGQGLDGFAVRPVARLVLHHPGGPRSSVERVMWDWFSGSGRVVDVAPYREEALFGSALGTGLPLAWRAAVVGSLFEWGRGLEPLRVAVGPQGGRQRRGTPSIIQGWQDGPASQKYGAEPMPVLI